ARPRGGRALRRGRLQQPRGAGPGSRRAMGTGRGRVPEARRPRAEPRGHRAGCRQLREVDPDCGDRGAGERRPGEARSQVAHERSRGHGPVRAGPGRPLARPVAPPRRRRELPRAQGQPELPGPAGAAALDRGLDQRGAEQVQRAGPGLQHDATPLSRLRDRELHRIRGEGLLQGGGGSVHRSPGPVRHARAHGVGARARAHEVVGVRLVFATVALLATAAPARTADEIPPPPAAFFNDYARLVSPDEAARMNEKLRRFADETSTQLLVVVFPRLPEGASLEEFTVATAQSWRVGQKKHDNGAILFVFVQDRKLRLEGGYGLEGALPDAVAKRVIAAGVAPGLRARRPPRGLDAAIAAMIAAPRGEYQAEPRRAAGGGGLPPVVVLVFVVLLFIVISSISSRASRLAGPGYRSRTYGRRGPWWGGFGGGGYGG